jgi:hypothetical protein
MRRKIHVCHMRRRIHECHMRKPRLKPTAGQSLNWHMRRRRMHVCHVPVARLSGALRRGGVCRSGA